MRPNTAYVVLFLLAAGVTAILHIIASLVPGYASYWWSNPIWATDTSILQSVLFVLLPLAGAVVRTALHRRWDWFPAIALGAVLLPLVLKLIDDASGQVLSRLFSGNDYYWLFPMII